MPYSRCDRCVHRARLLGAARIARAAVLPSAQETARSRAVPVWKCTASSTSSAWATRSNVLSRGSTPPASNRATTDCVTPIRSASSCCDRPRSVRRRRTSSPMWKERIVAQYACRASDCDSRSARSSLHARRRLIDSVLRCVPFQHTALHRALRPLDLGALPCALLAKHREKDRPLPTRQVVRDALPVPAHVEAQLPELAAELPCVRLVEDRTTLGEQVDIERGLAEVRIAERSQPLFDLRFQFDGAPCHSIYAIRCCVENAREARARRCSTTFGGGSP